MARPRDEVYMLTLFPGALTVVTVTVKGRVLVTVPVHPPSSVLPSALHGLTRLPAVVL